MHCFVKLMASVTENDALITTETMQPFSLPMSLTIRAFHNNLKNETL